MNGAGFPISFFGWGGWAPRAWCSDATKTPSGPIEPDGTAFSKRVNIADIEHPSGVMLLGEMPAAPPNYKVSGSFTTDAAYGLPIGKPYINFCQVTNLTSAAAGTCPDASFAQWINDGCNQNVAAFHSQGMNTLYPDGHVTRVSKTDLFRYCLDVGDKLRTGETNVSAGWLFWDGLKTPNGSYNWHWGKLPGYSVN